MVKNLERTAPDHGIKSWSHLKMVYLFKKGFWLGSSTKEHQDKTNFVPIEMHCNCQYFASVWECQKNNIPFEKLRNYLVRKKWILLVFIHLWVWLHIFVQFPIAEPAWLWDPLPEAPNRKGTESGLISYVKSPTQIQFKQRVAVISIFLKQMKLNFMKYKIYK